MLLYQYIFGVRISDIESVPALQQSESSANLKVNIKRPSTGYIIPQIRVSSIDELIRDITSNKFDGKALCLFNITIISLTTIADLKVRDAFLLSYKNFLTSLDLLHKLIARYCITPVEKDLTDDQLAEIRLEKQIPVRSR